MSALVFVDVETTGLHLEAGHRVWEFAAIRREEDGSQYAVHTFVQHRLAAFDLPPAFMDDYKARFDEDAAMELPELGALVWSLTRDKPQLVGACPWFDEAFLRHALLVAGLTPRWSHRLVDVESLASGYLRRPVAGLADALGDLGLTNPHPHTAAGDAQAALAIYDTVMAAPILEQVSR